MVEKAVVSTPLLTALLLLLLDVKLGIVTPPEDLVPSPTEVRVLPSIANGLPGENGPLAPSNVAVESKLSDEPQIRVPWMVVLNVPDHLRRPVIATPNAVLLTVVTLIGLLGHLAPCVLNTTATEPEPWSETQVVVALNVMKPSFSPANVLHVLPKTAKESTRLVLATVLLMASQDLPSTPLNGSKSKLEVENHVLCLMVTPGLAPVPLIKSKLVLPLVKNSKVMVETGLAAIATISPNTSSTASSNRQPMVEQPANSPKTSPNGSPVSLKTTVPTLGPHVAMMTNVTMNWPVLLTNASLLNPLVAIIVLGLVELIVSPPTNANLNSVIKLLDA